MNTATLAAKAAPGSLSWESCFDKLTAMDLESVRLVRRAAAILLTSEGAEEVGSSDINHRIFAEYRRCEGDLAFTIETLIGKALNASV